MSKKKKKEKIAKPPSRARKCVAAWLKAQLWIVNLFFVLAGGVLVWLGVSSTPAAVDSAEKPWAKYTATTIASQATVIASSRVISAGSFRNTLFRALPEAVQGLVMTSSERTSSVATCRARQQHQSELS